MNAVRTITFTLRAKVEGQEVTPATITLPLFNKFNREVEDFLAGSGRKVPLDEAKIFIGDGSYRLGVLLSLLIAGPVENDLHQLEKEDALHTIDPRRAQIVRIWQDMTRKDPDSSVEIVSSNAMFKPVAISHKTDFHAKEQNEWVAVEKYMTGRIVDIGGATKANVHLVLEENGRTLIIASTEDYLRDQKQNYLYRKAQLQISAEENIRTGELRHEKLMAFIGEGPAYDENELDVLIDKGTKAWADVPDSVAWVREQRGGYDE
jgi:hypothetical protein